MDEVGEHRPLDPRLRNSRLEEMEARSPYSEGIEWAKPIAVLR